MVNASGVSEASAGGDLFEDFVFLLGGCGLIEDDKRMEEARFVFVEVQGFSNGFDARVTEIAFAVHDEFDEIWRAEACTACEVAKRVDARMLFCSVVEVPEICPVVEI